jgi:Leucine-rich repeat (LRR) protein
MLRYSFAFIFFCCALPAFLLAQTPKPTKPPKMPTDTLLSEVELGRKPLYYNIGQAYKQWEKVHRLQLKTSGSLYGKVDEVHYRIDSLINLQYFQCANEALETLPASFGALRNMQQLYLSGNKFVVLPDTVYQLTNLKRLDVANNQIIAISEKIANLKQLEMLYLHSNKTLKSLPVEQIGKLQNLRFLNLKGTQIPREQAQRLQKLLPKCKVEFDY